MTQEEKAKAYDEAFERAKQWRNAPNVDKIPTFANRVIEEIFPELKESEDERIRKEIISAIKEDWPGHADWIAWIEKQEQHKKFLDSIQVGDKVTRNRDGVLVNLSQLNRVAKKDEKQGEQNPAWSEEDEERVEEMIEYLEELYDRNRFSLDELNDKKHWLKSLRPQNRWKPSDEQMDALLKL